MNDMDLGIMLSKLNEIYPNSLEFHISLALGIAGIISVTIFILCICKYIGILPDDRELYP